MTVHIYSDFAVGNDAWDGSQATAGGGSVGPKKHLDRAVGPAWPMKPLLKYQTTISTAAPKGSYAAVGLEHDSSLMILKSIPDESTGGPDIPAAAELQILNTTLAKSAAYYGIVLNSRSLLVGANQVRFNDEAINQGKDTVPDGQQIVAKTHSVAEE